MHRIKCLSILLSIWATHTTAGQVYAELSARIQADEKYVIYSHGLIVEGRNPKPLHPKFGIYDFPLIKAMLAEGNDFKVIAPHRPKSSAMEDHANVLASWVNALIEAGVRPDNISLVGFSRGGQITAYASSMLKPLQINTILLATCWPGSVQIDPTVTFSGSFLSIYETTDNARSCKEISDRSEGLTSFDEVEISTGEAHGAFYRPIEDWITPVRNWIDSKGT